MCLSNFGKSQLQDKIENSDGSNIVSKKSLIEIKRFCF